MKWNRRDPMHSIIETVSRMKDHNYSYQRSQVTGRPLSPSDHIITASVSVQTLPACHHDSNQLHPIQQLPRKHGRLPRDLAGQITRSSNPMATRGDRSRTRCEYFRGIYWVCRELVWAVGGARREGGRGASLRRMRDDDVMGGDAEGWTCRGVNGLAGGGIWRV